MENIQNNIETDFLNNFHYNQKDNYNWDIISISKDNENKRSVLFCGINKQDKNDCIFVKRIKLDFSSEIFIKEILNEVYFLVLLKNQKYFVQISDILLDNENNFNFIYLVFKGNYISLDKLINSKENIYLSNKDLIKWIIYQITFGLYVLHSNNIIHNNIKPSNILINEIAGITICDLGSAVYMGENSFTYTQYYSPPEFLYNNNNINREYNSDMWSLGIIIIELLLKKNRYFKLNNGEKTNEEQLQKILSRFGVNENIQSEEIKRLLEDNSNTLKFKFTDEELKEIQDKDVIDLVQNLLVLNPNKRFTAKQVLMSEYLSKIFGVIDSLDIKNLEKPINYNYDLLGQIDRNKFLEKIIILSSKLNELK